MEDKQQPMPEPQRQRQRLLWGPDRWWFVALPVAAAAGTAGKLEERKVRERDAVQQMGFGLGLGLGVNERTRNVKDAVHIFSSGARFRFACHSVHFHYFVLFLPAPFGSWLLPFLFLVIRFWR